VPTPYFSATKLSYLLHQIPDGHARAARGEIAFGTVDSWLCYQLSEKQLHITDVSNASRTMLFNLHTGQWDSELLDLFNIPAAVLPEIVPSAHKAGSTCLFGAEIPCAGLPVISRRPCSDKPVCVPAWQKIPMAPAALC
jgi:glycerol kinase